MNLHKLNLQELTSSELQQISGGGIFYSIGYAVGYVIGQAVNVVKAVYQRNYDAAQNNCECQQ